MKLLSAAGAGNGSTFNIQNYECQKRSYGVVVAGTLDGSTVTLEVSPDGTAWATAATFTAAGYERHVLHGKAIRGVVTGGTSPAVDMWAVQ